MHYTLGEGIFKLQLKNNEKMLAGRTETNKVVVFEGDTNLINKII